MKSFFEKEVLAHPLVMSALGAVVVIALGSGVYYFVSTRSPQSSVATVEMGSINETVTGSGTVEPSQNPNLAFVGGGRVVSVHASVGAQVYQGQVLAALDTASLHAQEAMAEANVEAAQAKLDSLNAGARATDVQSGQTAVAQAQQSLANVYANIPATLTDAYNKTYNGVRQNTDALFNQPTMPQPTVTFQTSNSQAAVDASNARTTLNVQLPSWSSTIDSLNTASDAHTIDAALSASIVQLTNVRTYTSTLLQALANAVPSSNFTAAQIATAQTSVSTLNSTASSLILSLQGAQQQIASGKLAVQSAQDALNKIQAGATSQDIAAQTAQVDAAKAQVASIEAQIANNIIVAPFSGTVASVNVKAGQTVAPNTVAVSLTPQSALQVKLYVSEVDVAKLQTGDSAQVTLDAYGSGKIFPATVASIDRSPTTESGMSGYKVVLQFTNNDESISTGMGANATILAAQKQNVVVIQKSAVLQNGANTFVLVPGGKTPIEKQIQTGIADDTNIEVTSGLSAGDQYLVNSK